jgi:hypothetical protein
MVDVDAALVVKYVPAWFPGAEFQRHALRARLDHRRLRDKPMEVVMAEMVSCLVITVWSSSVFDPDI